MLKRISTVIGAMAIFGLGYLFGSAPGLTTQAMKGAAPAAQPGCQTFKETGKTVCGKFLIYWNAHGGLAQQGFPISGEFQEISELNGKPYTVQYFERAEFEMHPENQPPYDVLLSQLGTFEYRRKYGTGGQPTSVPPPAPTATQVSLPPAFVGIEDEVERNGMVFAVTRVDLINNKRMDVIYKLTNNTGGPMTVVLRVSDQHLVSNLGTEQTKADPNAVATVTLQNGETYNGGTSFLIDINDVRIKAFTFAIDNLPRIGSVRVNIPLTL
jgi:hypothetical protein